MAGHKWSVVGLSVKRIAHELLWSLLVAAVLTGVLTAGILIPSTSSSLNNELAAYTNGIATYVAISSGQGVGVVGCIPGQPSCITSLPKEVVDNISSIKGVQQVWPLMTNATNFMGYVTSFNINTGKNETYFMNQLQRSAVIGGPRGFPDSLLTLASGRLPTSSQPEIMFNGNGIASNQVNKTYTVDIACIYCKNLYNVTGPFNATAVGMLAANPMLGGVEVLWNADFLKNFMGQSLYNQTFVGTDQSYSNFVIVKVDTVQDVQSVVTAIQGVLQAYPFFGLYYNQAFKTSVLSYTGLVGPVYETLGLASLLSVAAVIFLVSYMVVGRRAWEAGLVVTEGWSWRKVLQYYWSYLLSIGFISLILAVALSEYLSGLFGATYDVMGTTVSFVASVDLTYLMAAVALLLLAAFLSPLAYVRKLKRMGLDTILREY